MQKITIPQTPDEVTQEHSDWVLENVLNLRKEVAGESEPLPGEIRWYEGNALRYIGRPNPFLNMNHAWEAVYAAEKKDIYLEINCISEGNEIKKQIAVFIFQKTINHLDSRLYLSSREVKEIRSFDITACVMAAVIKQEEG